MRVSVFIGHLLVTGTREARAHVHVPMLSKSYIPRGYNPNSLFLPCPENFPENSVWNLYRERYGRADTWSKDGGKERKDDRLGRMEG